LYIFVAGMMWDLVGEVIPTAILPGIYSVTPCIMCLIAIPITINDLRKSILLKRLGASPVKP